ncbi:MAG: hypothetical protein IPK19_35915 [Chloroflexi bacterium]|nr:hypothetical protein [Chloroflexota bacterium]
MRHRQRIGDLVEQTGGELKSTGAMLVEHRSQTAGAQQTHDNIDIVFRFKVIVERVICGCSSRAMSLRISGKTVQEFCECGRHIVDAKS